MKRFIILFALIISAVGASAQSIGTLFRQYRYEEKANYMHITRFAMSIVKAFAKTDSEDKEALKALSSFRILSLEDCTFDRQTELSKDAPDLPSNRIHAFHHRKKE